jgi:hypothetical protein
MPDIRIENEFQYRALRTRIAVLDTHLHTIADLHRRARDSRAELRIEDADLKDLAPLDDAAADITWTRERLREAAGEWEDRIEYGQHPA